MYVYNHRFSEMEKHGGSGEVYSGYSWIPNIKGTVQTSFPQVVEAVYSWRTGRGAQVDLGSVQPSEIRDGWGIVTPRKGGDLGTRLADRKRYYEEVQRAAFPAETATGSLSMDRVSRVDSGHLFTKVTNVFIPITARVDLDYYYYRYHGTVFSMPDVVWNASGRTMSIPTQSYSVTSSLARQNMFNEVFQSITPNRPDGAIFVALMELLRGDIPSFIGNLKRFTSVSGRSYKDYREAASAVGDQYLNSIFGWTPLVKEIQGILNVLITIDRMVYAESYRRKRSWEGPSSSSEGLYSHELGLNTQSRPGTVETVTGSRPLAPVSYTATSRTTIGENYRFSSRLSALSRPTSKTIGFAEKAEEILQRLGFVTSIAEVWELVPYSWLIDWVSNIGASLHNANVYSPVRGKYTVDYAYVTTVTSRTTERIFRSGTISNGSPANFKVLRGKSFESSLTKSRDRATPFGFGTQLASITTGQFAILTALGLAKIR